MQKYKDALNGTYDLSSNFLGFELAARRFYFGFERGILGNTQYSSGEQDLGIFDIRFGCRVVKTKVCTFDIFESLLTIDGINTSFGTDDSSTSLMLGGNLNFNFGNKILLQGFYEIPLNDVNMIAYNVKAGFLLTPNFAFTAGYRGYEIEADDEDYVDQTTSSLKGSTLGVEFRF
jgi:hypothetical protein